MVGRNGVQDCLKSKAILCSLHLISLCAYFMYCSYFLLEARIQQ